MQADKFILSLLRNLPDQKIEGKKRLQKLVMLLQYAGAEVDTKFSIHHYGPFSSDVARMTEILTMTGQLNEEMKVVGSSRLFQSVYTLPDDDVADAAEFSWCETLQKLSDFSTIELEVASTIAFFISAGKSPAEAITATKEMKPSKTTDRVMSKVAKVLEVVS